MDKKFLQALTLSAICLASVGTTSATPSNQWCGIKTGKVGTYLNLTPTLT